VVACDPTDAWAHHNLGTVYLRTGPFNEAARSLRQSLRYRSNNVATYLNLASALKESGRLEEAMQAWEQVLRLSPGEPTARRELIRAGRAAVLVGY
jgi:cytochrome c-type biogenesis protein CcmH/NrfG